VGKKFSNFLAVGRRQRADAALSGDEPNAGARKPAVFSTAATGDTRHAIVQFDWSAPSQHPPSLALLTVVQSAPLLAAEANAGRPAISVTAIRKVRILRKVICQPGSISCNTTQIRVGRIIVL